MGIGCARCDAQQGLPKVDTGSGKPAQTKSRGPAMNLERPRNCGVSTGSDPAPGTAPAMGCLFAAEIAPKQGFQKHVPAKAEMVFSVLEKSAAKTKESKPTFVGQPRNACLAPRPDAQAKNRIDPNGGDPSEVGKIDVPTMGRVMVHERVNVSAHWGVGKCTQRKPAPRHLERA